MSAYKRPSVFLNKNNNSYVGSISSFKTNRTARIQIVNTEVEDNDYSAPAVDPRFMVIEKVFRPPSPKKLPQIANKRNYNWIEKSQIDIRKSVLSQIPITGSGKRNLQNFKRTSHHVSKSASRSSKLRSSSISRTCVSNYEVSSTNEELFTPRRRRPTIKEKLRKLHTSLPTSNQQTFDVHYVGCTNDSDDCCLHRQCSENENDCNVINLCCKPKREYTVPVLKYEYKTIEKIGDGLDPKPLFVGEHVTGVTDQSKQTIENYFCTRRRKICTFHPIYKLISPIVIFIMISLSVLSVHYEYGIAYRAWEMFRLSFNSYRLISLRRPLSKWELWVIFVKKATEKIVGVIFSRIL